MVKKGEIYRHYKGNIYTVSEIALHSETLEKLVIYADTEGRVWARPQAMFEEKLPDGRNRFELMGRNNANSSPL